MKKRSAHTTGSTVEAAVCERAAGGGRGQVIRAAGGRAMWVSESGSHGCWRESRRVKKAFF
jgi:hypothetical protein